MNKAFHNFAWRNYPDDNTPLNESNLNKVNNALDEVDDRVIALDNTKATKAEVATLVKEISFNEATGVFTITRKNNAIFTIDTKLEKIAVNFSYNPTTQQIILTLIDGTKQYIDLSALITQYEFLDSDTVNFQLQTDGRVTAIVKEGSIQEKHLRPDYLADIKAESAKAAAGATAAAKSETNAKASETAAKSSETEAKKSEANAASSAAAAADKANEAAESEANAAASATTAAQKATSAQTSETNSAASANEASSKARESADYAKQSQSYAVGTGNVRPNESTDSAKYYYEQIKDIYEDIGGSGGIVDSAMSDTSKNAVENRVIKSYVDTKKFDASAIISGTLNVKRIPRAYKQLFQGSHSLSSEQNGIKISGADLREFRDIFVNLYIQSSSGLEIGDGMPVCIALRDGYWNYQTIPVLWKAHTPYITLAITGMQAAYGNDSIEFLNVDGNGFSYETFAEDTFLFSQNKSLANVAPALGFNFEIESVFGAY